MLAVKSSIADLEGSRAKLQRSVADAAERNKDLLSTADKLRDVLKIAGENSGSLQEVESKLFGEQ